jgi:hypothetical protein
MNRTKIPVSYLCEAYRNVLGVKYFTFRRDLTSAVRLFSTFSTSLKPVVVPFYPTFLILKKKIK